MIRTISKMLEFNQDHIKILNYTNQRCSVSYLRKRSWVQPPELKKETHSLNQYCLEFFNIINIFTNTLLIMNDWVYAIN